MAILAAGRYTVGSVLEEQADDAAGHFDQEAAFEAGLALIVDGLTRRTEQ
jgi:TetR/AcrR family tetracycline transcriptional repressor